MNAKEAMDWLLTRPKTDLADGVARVQWLLDHLGNPEKRVATVHFVGTNGKGSTLNALRAILMEAGYRVGRFTSPSILDYREQIVYQEEMIAEADLVQILEDLRPLVARLPVETILGDASEFEVLVVAMFVYFAYSKQTDILLVEAGMGGRLDATNVLSPLAVVCPSIGLDHQAFLGETVAEIAQHKVAVLKEGVPLLYATNSLEVEAVFEEWAERLACPCYALGKEIMVEEQDEGFSITTPLGKLEHLQLRMKGQHQKGNAALAIMAAQLLQESFPAITDAALRKGLATAVWPGRIEQIGEKWLLDGAHNPASIAVLCQFLEETYPTRKKAILFAAIQTKPVEVMVEQLARHGVVTVTTFSDERAVALEDYPASYPRIASFEDWIEQAEKDSSDTLYIVTGSLYFIRFVRQHLVGK